MKLLDFFNISNHLNIVFGKIFYHYLFSKADKMEIVSFKVEKNKSIPIKELLIAIEAFNQATSEFIQYKSGEKVELQLQSVQKGSDVFNLVLVGAGLFLASGEIIKVINDFFTLFKNLKIIDQKSAKDIKDDRLYSKNFVENLECIADFTNNENIHHIEIHNNKNYIILNKEFAKELKDNLALIKKIKDYDRKEVKEIHTQRLIEFYQTTNTEKEVRHKAFCYEISDKAIATFITDTKLREEKLNNPYNYRFLVDLEVYRDTQGKILNYRVFHYQDKILKE